MTVTTESLRELHRIHQQLRDLRERLDRGPKQIAARASNVTRLEEELAKAQDEAKAARVASDQKQLLLKSGESKIGELHVKLNGASSNREYQALKDQIAADEMANSVLADEILEMLERIDELDSAIAAARGKLEQAKQELEICRAQVRDQEESLKADVTRLEGELVEAEKSLPPDVLDSYRRIVAGKGAEAMAQVEGETCGGCYQHLTPNSMSSLLMDHVVFCKSCGRLLYLPEDRSPARRTTS